MSPVTRTTTTSIFAIVIVIGVPILFFTLVVSPVVHVVNIQVCFEVYGVACSVECARVCPLIDVPVRTLDGARKSVAL